MWHEARKQERRIRGMIVDYRKRAERRQDFYEKIQADPTQFIQIHGRRCKIHLDPAVAAAGDGAAIIVPWQGQADNLIDRFDVRAHLDFIPPVQKNLEADAIEPNPEERQCNYERYRILAQNDFLNVAEDKFLHQLYLEEQFGVNAQLEAEKNVGKKKHHKSGATISYSYEDSSMGPQPFSHLMHPPAHLAVRPGNQTEEKGSESDSDSDMDMDVSIDISRLDTMQAHELNGCGRNYGMTSNDFYSFLTKDADEADALRIAREEEQEKMLLSGRKSRRERRAQKERRIAARPFSPPSYAAKDDANKDVKEDSESRSPSPADVNAGKITYITSFGGEDELHAHSKITFNLSKGPHTLGEACKGAIAAAAGQITYAQKVKDNLEKLKAVNESSKRSRRRSDSRSRSRSIGRRGRHRRMRSYSRSRSRSRDRRRGRSHSRSRSRTRSSSYSQRYRRNKRSRTRSRTRRVRRKHDQSSSSSSSSSERSKSRGRSKSRSRSRSQKRILSRVAVSAKPKTVVPSSIKTPLVETVALPKAPPLITYPLSARLGLTPAPAGAKPMVPMIAPTPAPPAVVAPVTPQVVEPPPPPLKRYYGRKRGDDSSDSEDSDSEAEKEAPTAAPTQEGDVDVDDAASDERMDVDTTSERSNPLPGSATSTGKLTGKYSAAAQAKNPSYSNATDNKGSMSTGGGGSGASARLNLRERLKRKMQNLLNKQYKADKQAEIEKSERERQLQQERDDEMRELALRLRRRQRELRHRCGSPSTDKASDTDASETRTPRRSHSQSSVASSVGKAQHQIAESRELEVLPQVPQQRPRSRSREREREWRRLSRSRSRSRSKSHYRGTQRRSRSRSRGNRRSASRRRRRSASRSRYQRERSSERSSRYGADRLRRSRSRNERAMIRDRDRERDNRDRRDRDRNRNRDWDRDRDRDRDWARSRDRRGGDDGGRSSRPAPESATAGNRNRVVISAPPKLKKLVDY